MLETIIVNKIRIRKETLVPGKISNSMRCDNKSNLDTHTSHFTYSYNNDLYVLIVKSLQITKVPSSVWKGQLLMLTKLY